MPKILDFERPTEEIYEKIRDLKRLATDHQVDFSDEIALMEKRAQSLRTKLLKNLSPLQTLQIARHPDRPGFSDYARLTFHDFVELHGDRVFGDDPALVGGLAFLADVPVMIIGHQKGKDTKSNIHRNFGMAQPEGYRKSLRLMQLAQKLKRPIITLVDTPGAYPGKGSEERGVAEAIAHNLRDMVGIEVPIIVVVMGEGGSGGALGIAVGNSIAMLEHSVYSVISPEGCASILYRDASRLETAMNNLKIRAEDTLRLGIIDEIIPEPLGGAHRDPEKMGANLHHYLLKELESYQKTSPKKIKDERYQKFRKMGVWGSEIADGG